MNCVLLSVNCVEILSWDTDSDGDGDADGDSDADDEFLWWYWRLHTFHLYGLNWYVWCAY